jgi:alpha-mannosidase
MGLYTGSGLEIPYELIDQDIVFIAEDIPSIGYATYYLRKTRTARAKPDMKIGKDFLENEYLRVVLDAKTGNIASIFDKVNKKEILEQGKGGNVLEIFEDIPSEFDAWNIGYTGKEWKIEDVKSLSIKTQNPYRVSLRVERAFGDSTFTQDLTLLKGVPRLDIENTIDWKESHRLLKAAFNLAVKNDFATYEIPYGTIERAAVPKNSLDKAKYEVCGHTWIDLTDQSGTYGVSLLNDSKYGFDIKDSKMRITLLRAPKYPDPEADRGAHKFAYSIYPHKGDWREGQTFHKGYELNYPLRAMIGGSSGSTGRPESLSLVAASSPDIMITAVKKAEDSDHIVVRFFELHGKMVDAKLVFSKEPLRAAEADLIERPLRDVGFKGKTVLVPTRPHEIKTLLIRFKEDRPNRQNTGD